MRSIRHRAEGTIMGRTGKKGEVPAKAGLPNKAGGKSNKPLPATSDDDEDGDIATPKRDRYGEDDQPL